MNRNTNTNEWNIQSPTQDLVDDLKAVFTHAGLGGEAGEYKLLTQSFLYKFLNDKFLYQSTGTRWINTYEIYWPWVRRLWLALRDIGTSIAWLKPDQLIETLHRQQNERLFTRLWKRLLTKSPLTITISSLCIRTEVRIRLFDERLITDTISDGSKRNEVAKAIINLLTQWSSMRPFFTRFRLFLYLFEYMIKVTTKKMAVVVRWYYTPPLCGKDYRWYLGGKWPTIKRADLWPVCWFGTLLMNLA